MYSSWVTFSFVFVLTFKKLIKYDIKYMYLWSICIQGTLLNIIFWPIKSHNNSRSNLPESPSLSPFCVCVCFKSFFSYSFTHFEARLSQDESLTWNHIRETSIWVQSHFRFCCPPMPGLFQFLDSCLFFFFPPSHLLSFILNILDIILVSGTLSEN